MAVNGSVKMQRSVASPAIQASNVDWSVRLTWFNTRGGVNTFDGKMNSCCSL